MDHKKPHEKHLSAFSERLSKYRARIASELPIAKATANGYTGPVRIVDIEIMSIVMASAMTLNRTPMHMAAEIAVYALVATEVAPLEEREKLDKAVKGAILWDIHRGFVDGKRHSDLIETCFEYMLSRILGQTAKYAYSS